MKIGILTQTPDRNYGGILQNYALQQVLKNIGHTPITFMFRQKNSVVLFSYEWLKAVFRLILGKNGRFPEYKKDGIEFTQSFINNNINGTNNINFLFPQHIKQYGIDCMITGSDQVWRSKYNGGVLKYMYLSFAKGKKCKKIAYAASFGIDFWEYTPKQTAECAKLAKRFDAISVREKSGIKLCKEHLGVEAIEVLDPTLMLTAEHYASLCKNIPCRKEKFVAAYVLDLEDEKRKIVENFAKKNGLSLSVFTAGKNLQLTVEEWLSIFRDAAYVITDSFHGTVFSIINHKPFISIANAERGASRFHSLLEKFDLDSRLISDFAELKPIPEIDWASVDAKIGKWQEISKNFLETALCLK